MAGRETGVEKTAEGLDLLNYCLLPATRLQVWGGVPHPSVCAPLPFLALCSSLSLYVSLSFSVSPASVLLEFLVLSGAVGVAWL